MGQRGEVGVGVGVARRGVARGCNSQIPGVHISCTGGARNVGVARRGGAAGGGRAGAPGH